MQDNYLIKTLYQSKQANMKVHIKQNNSYKDSCIEIHLYRGNVTKDLLSQ